MSLYRLHITDSVVKNVIEVMSFGTFLLAACHKNTELVPISLVESIKDVKEPLA